MQTVKLVVSNPFEVNEDMSQSNREQKPIINLKMCEVSFATLNFSGPNNSPFQYHDGSPEMKRLNEIFTVIASKYTQVNQPGFTWNVGKIDVLLKKERYSILYQSDVGVIDGKLLNTHQFKVIWKYLFSKSKHLLKQHQTTEGMIELAMLFDWIAYESALTYVYGAEYDIKNIKNLDSRPYLKCLNDWHSKSFLNMHRKIREVCQYIDSKQLDVFFIQQAGDFSWQPYLPVGYHCVVRANSMICYKQDKLKVTQNKEFSKKYDQILDFNNDSCYLLCNDNIVLLSVHLSSKAHRFSQLKLMIDSLKKMIEEDKVQVIMGLDANQKVEAPDFHLFPDFEAITTAKKRTMMQFQFHKSQILVEEAKDYLISTFHMKQGKIETIAQHEAHNQLLPNQEHPFDHFVVSAKITDPLFHAHMPQNAEEIDLIVPLVLAETLHSALM